MGIKDEIFHIPQTQAYCAGRLDVWDTMITTLPGFHLLGSIWGRIICNLGGANLSSKQVSETLNIGIDCMDMSVYEHCLSWDDALYSSKWKTVNCAVPLMIY